LAEKLQVATGIECRELTVRYGSVTALANVSLALDAARIHAVVGQNGAGKTTFARVLAGIVQPSEGTVLIGDRRISTGDVNSARQAGVELVHQSFALPPSFTVAEAMEFGSERPGRWPFTRKALRARWEPHLHSLGVGVAPDAVIRDLPIETQQAVEIARALVSRAGVLILDEPTAVLAPGNIQALFARLRALRETGVTIILILHKIREVMAIAETVSVLRGGRLVEGPTPVANTSPQMLADAIVGTSAVQVGRLQADDVAALTGSGSGSPGRTASRERPGQPLLTLARVSTLADDEGLGLSTVDLEVGTGEIVGVAGVEGNGQKTLVRTLAGLAAVREGHILLADGDFTQASLLQRRAAGLRIIPFERNLEGLSLQSPLWENWSALRLLLNGFAFIDPAPLRRACDIALRRWDVRFATTRQKAGALSGGNAQKVILAREIDEDARVVIAAQPTRGLDIGASAFVWTSLRAIRDRGHGVLLISSDLDELFDICDRIVVMVSGRIAAEFRPPYSLSDVGSAMTGVGTP
jgi:simple sugar transport system ATP-binding protein